jgi:hypothetical protein
MGNIGVWSGQKILQVPVLGYTFIYLQIKHQYIIPCMYFTVGEKFKPRKDVVQLQYESVHPKGQGDSDNQRPDK